MIALLEEVEARKCEKVDRKDRGRGDRSKWDEHRAAANEYSIIASKIDPSCAMALNYMANYCFHTWELKKINARVRGPKELVIVSTEAINISTKDLIRFPELDGTEKYKVESLHKWQEVSDISIPFILLTLDRSIPLGAVGTDVKFEVRELGRALKLAQEATTSTTIKKIRAEGLYTMGKVNHIQDDITGALNYYRLSLQEVSNGFLSLYLISTSNPPYSERQHVPCSIRLCSDLSCPRGS